MKPDEMRELARLIQKVPGLKAVDIKDVKRLAELLQESPEVGSIELRGLFGTGIVVTRSGVTVSHGGAAPHGVAPAPSATPAAAGAAEPARPSPAAPPLKEVKSPMVGTYYSAPEPGADPYAKVGTRVAPGQTVCIIEAMKIMNEIEAEFGGVLREVCVEDAQPVEFGQVLFRVDPNA